MDGDAFLSDSEVDIEDILLQLANQGVKTSNNKHKIAKNSQENALAKVDNLDEMESEEVIAQEVDANREGPSEIIGDVETESLQFEYMLSSSDSEISELDVENVHRLSEEPEHGDIEVRENDADADMFGEFSGHIARDRGKKREKAKQLRERGEAYLGYRKPHGSTKIFQDKMKLARKIGPTCKSTSCQKSRVRNCSNFSESLRNCIFEQFWKNMSWEQRKIYVINLIKVIEPKRRTSIESVNNRSKTLQYFLKSGDKALQVCKNMFLQTLGIKYAIVRHWIENQENGIASKTEFVEKAKLRRKPFESQKNFLVNFFKSLPTVPSHYCRKSSTKQYLQPPITSKSEVFDLYTKKCDEESILNKVSKIYFYKEFRKQNIGIFSPKKDQCDLCVAHKQGNILDEEYNSHIECKQKARDSKETDKNLALEGKINMFCMDLQAVKLCPSLQASALYFKTKLTVHNYTIYNIATKEVKCFWFDETNADLTASTFTSLLIQFLTQILEKSKLPIVLITDGCTYQNRNIILANALLRLAMRYKTQITQKFLIKGHTQMECDSVHSVIERKLRNKEIYLPSQYVNITKEARSNLVPYEAESIDFTQILNYSDNSNFIYKSIRPGSFAGDETVTNLKVILYDPSGKILYKTNYDDDFAELPQRRNTSALKIDVVYPRLHCERIKISQAKYKHLQELKAVIPKDCHHFYDNLPYIGISKK